MPNKGKTPTRSFRVPNEIFEPAAEKLREDGANMTDLLREAMIQYVSGEWEPWQTGSIAPK